MTQIPGNYKCIDLCQDGALFWAGRGKLCVECCRVSRCHGLFWKRGKDPHPDNFNLAKKWPILVRADLILTKDLKIGLMKGNALW